MIKQEQIEIKLFGLQHEGSGDVRADVFAKKIANLVKALKAADRQSHGNKTYDYFITNLAYSSAYATVAERPYSTKKIPQKSSVKAIHSVVASVRDGQGIPKGTDPTIASVLAAIGNGAGKAFSHGEIGIKGQAETVVTIDRFFDKRAERAYAEFRSASNLVHLFEGVAFGTFDGELKEVDLRGTVARAKLVLNIGGKELDCTCNSVTVENLQRIFGNGREALLLGFLCIHCLPE